MNTSSQWIAAACAAVISLGMCLTPAWAASRAIVVTGWDDAESNRDAMSKEADLAERIYTENGYRITRVNHATKAELLALFCQSDATMFFYAGHGVYVNEAGDGIATLELRPGTGAAGQLSAQEVIDSVPLNCRQRFRQVVLNACSQRQVGWAVAFPHARVWGFDTPVTNSTCFNDLKANGSNRTPIKGARGEGDENGAGLQSSPVVDARIASVIPVTFDFSTRNFLATGWWRYRDMPWRMPAPLAALVGTKRFNIYVGPNLADLSLLKALEVVDGKVTGERIVPLASTDFDVTFLGDAFERATANIDSLPELFAEGAAFISGNTTGLPDPVLFMGVSAVVFGKGAVIPICEGDADASGAVGLGDIALILTHWGLTGVPGQLGDLDHDAVRGLGDIAQVIANWGASCE